MRTVLLILVACSSTPNQPSAPASPPAPRQATKCGSATCTATEICVPGGESRNGVGETVMLPPEHCAPLPAACNGVASCDCLGNACPIGGCSSVDGGRLICIAG